MENLTSLEKVRKFVSDTKMSLLYLSRPDCGVCTAIKPKVIELLESYPEIESVYIDLDQIPEAAGEFSVFTIPGVLVYAEGKEFIREARYISMDDLEDKIARPYGLLFE